MKRYLRIIGTILLAPVLFLTVLFAALVMSVSVALRVLYEGLSVIIDAIWGDDL